MLAGFLVRMLPGAIRTMATRASGAWYALAAAVLLGDQLAKTVISQLFGYGEQVGITPFFNLVHVRNNGAAFSLLAGAGVWARVGFAALAMCISLWLIDQLRRGAPRWEAAGYCLILGGALGNAADRLLRGAVVDFLDFHWRGTHWPAFNLADVAITVGAVCLIVATRRRGGQIRANSTA
jgi:signal peptidase II